MSTWSGDLPPQAPPGIARADVQLGEEWHAGFMCYGIPVGSKEYVKHMLGSKVEDVKDEIQRVKSVLGTQDSQAMWTVFSSSIAQKLDWHLSLSYPSDIK